MSARAWKHSPVGVRDEHKSKLDVLTDRLGEEHQINGQKVSVSRTGYFYETRKRAITWKFEADHICKQWVRGYDDCRNHDNEAIPIFRRRDWARNRYRDSDGRVSMILIRSLSKLEKPVFWGGRNNSFPGFLYYSKPNDKLLPLTPGVLHSGDAYASSWPKSSNCINSSLDDMFGNYLKEFLVDQPERGLLEQDVHNFLLLLLMRKGHEISNERPVARASNSGKGCQKLGN